METGVATGLVGRASLCTASLYCVQTAKVLLVLRGRTRSPEPLRLPMPMSVLSMLNPTTCILLSFHSWIQIFILIFLHEMIDKIKLIQTSDI